MTLTKNLSILFICVLCCVLMCACTSNKATTYTSYSENYETTSEFQKTYYDNIDIIITPIEKNSNKASIEVTIPSLTEIYKNNKTAILNATSSEEIQTILNNHISEFSITQTFTENVYTDEGELRLVSTEQIDKLIATEVDKYLETIMNDCQETTQTINIVLPDLTEDTTGMEEKQ